LEQYPYKQGEKAMEMIIKVLREKAEDDQSEDHFYSEVLPATIMVH
jgi:hypothetical protein